jgi:hypothetical protein
MDTQDSFKVPTEPVKPTNTATNPSTTTTAPPTTGSNSKSRFFVLNFMKNQSQLQTFAYQTYKVLPYVLAFGYIISALLKMPTYHGMLVLVYQVYQNKKEQAATGQKEQEKPPSKSFDRLIGNRTHFN